LRGGENLLAVRPARQECAGTGEHRVRGIGPEGRRQAGSDERTEAHVLIQCPAQPHRAALRSFRRGEQSDLFQGRRYLSGIDPGDRPRRGSDGRGLHGLGKLVPPQNPVRIRRVVIARAIGPFCHAALPSTPHPPS